MGVGPELLEQIGEALYGPRWKSELSSDLDVDDRTMRRWVAGDNAIPIGVTAELLRLLTERAADIDDLIPRLKRG